MLVTVSQEPVTALHISRTGNRPEARAVDAYSIRRQNMQDLLRDHAKGNQSAFAELLDRPPNLVNRYLHAKPIGPKFARYVEGRFKKGKGWLDRDHSVQANDAIVPDDPDDVRRARAKLSEMGVRVGRKWELLQEPARGQMLFLMETLLAMQSNPKESNKKERAAEKKAYESLMQTDE